MRRMSLFTVTGLVAAGLALSACGSNSLSSGSSPAGTGVAPTNQASDAALVGKLPAKIKSAGKIVVGVDTSYPPNEFLGADGKTAEGMDVDLFEAVARPSSVCKTEFQTASFDSIILGVSSGKYDVGVSSFTINPDRKKQVDMVSYYTAGTQWVSPRATPRRSTPTTPAASTSACRRARRRSTT